MEERGNNKGGRKEEKIVVKIEENRLGRESG